MSSDKDPLYFYKQLELLQDYLKNAELVKCNIDKINELKPDDSPKTTQRTKGLSTTDKLIQTFVAFSQRSNVDCYGKIFVYDNWFIKFIWIIILFASLGFTSYQVLSNLSAYFEYSVSTQIGVVYEMPADFPAVTFCDSNAFTSADAQNLFLQNFNDGNWYSTYKKMFMVASDPVYRDENRKKLGFSLEQISSCTYNNTNCKNDLNWYDLNHIITGLYFFLRIILRVITVKFKIIRLITPATTPVN